MDSFKDTSLEAFLTVDKRTMRERVLDAICEFGPVTDEELVDLCGLSANTVRPRRIELVKAGMVVPSGVKLTRSGRDATSWVGVGLL